MTSPRLEIDLAKVEHNAQNLVSKLAERNILVSGVTKAMHGNPAFAKTILAAGVSGLADSRIENIQTMRLAGINAPISLIRSPMISQAARVVKAATQSLNTELDVIAALSQAATANNVEHGIVLMVELGDLREGIMPCDLERLVGKVLGLSNIRLDGIGTNLACQNGVVPDAKNMGELSALANRIDRNFNIKLPIVSGGNSANLVWALGSEEIGRVNHLRLGESILLGREPIHRKPLDGLFTDAFVLFAEVIESKTKPAEPTGKTGQAAFGSIKTIKKQGNIRQTLLALGIMDTDPQGLLPMQDVEIIGASSDHIVVDVGQQITPVGSELAFEPNYSALIRAMASPYVAKRYHRDGVLLNQFADQSALKDLVH